jgi:hypothetical protein
LEFGIADLGMSVHWPLRGVCCILLNGYTMSQDGL